MPTLIGKPFSKEDDGNGKVKVAECYHCGDMFTFAGVNGTPKYHAQSAMDTTTPTKKMQLQLCRQHRAKVEMLRKMQPQFRCHVVMSLVRRSGRIRLNREGRMESASWEAGHQQISYMSPKSLA